MSDKDKPEDNVVSIFSQSAEKQEDTRPDHIAWLNAMENHHDRERTIRNFPKTIAELLAATKKQAADFAKTHPGQNTYIPSAKIIIPTLMNAQAWAYCVESFRKDLQENDPEEYSDIYNALQETIVMDFQSVTKEKGPTVEIEESDLNYMFGDALLLKAPQYKTFKELFKENFPGLIVSFDLESSDNEGVALYPVVTLTVGVQAPSKTLKDIPALFQEYLDKKRSHLQVVKPDAPENKPN